MKTIITLLLFFLSIHFCNSQCWRVISAGKEHTLAIKTDGSLWAWGNNKYGQLGNGTIEKNYAPVQIGNETDWKYISAGDYHSAAIKEGGKLYTWGKNDSGQLGVGNTDNQLVPVQVSPTSVWVKVSAGGMHTMAIKSDHSLWGWGANIHGQLGNSVSSSELLPVQTGNKTNDWYQVSAGYTFTLAIKNTFTLFATGLNNYGQLGLGDNVGRNKFVQIGTKNNWINVVSGGFHAMALNAEGQLFAWGYNEHGQVGDGTVITSLCPVQIGQTDKWRTISCGKYHSAGITKDDILKVWGYNLNGLLGINSNIDQHFPVSVNSDTNWGIISLTNSNVILAIKKDNTLWACGYNTFGQYGNNGNNSVEIIKPVLNCNISTAVPIENNEDISVSPNPVNDYLYIKANTPSKPGGIAIYDLLGQKVISKEKFVSEINVQHLSSGMYIICIEVDDKVIQTKFIK